jgi:hypothetical protein
MSRTGSSWVKSPTQLASGVDPDRRPELRTTPHTRGDRQEVWCGPGRRARADCASGSLGLTIDGRTARMRWNSSRRSKRLMSECSPLPGSPFADGFKYGITQLVWGTLNNVGSRVIVELGTRRARWTHQRRLLDPRRHDHRHALQGRLS